MRGRRKAGGCSPPPHTSCAHQSARHHGGQVHVAQIIMAVITHGMLIAARRTTAVKASRWSRHPLCTRDNNRDIYELGRRTCYERPLDPPSCGLDSRWPFLHAGVHEPYTQLGPCKPATIWVSTVDGLLAPITCPIHTTGSYAFRWPILLRSPYWLDRRYPSYLYHHRSGRAGYIQYNRLYLICVHWALDRESGCQTRVA